MLDPRRRVAESVPPAARFVAGVFGFAFFGIGLSVLIFLWVTPRDAFGAPPFFFRVFGSFIALVFVAVGGATCLSAILGKDLLRGGSAADLKKMVGSLRGVSDAQQQDQGPENAPGTLSGGYACPHCSAPLAEGADVSPHGDTKCRYCHAWFNIHGKSG